MNIENILLRMANEVLDLPNNNLPIGIPIDKARLAIEAEITKARIQEVKGFDQAGFNTGTYIDDRIAQLRGK